MSHFKIQVPGKWDDDLIWFNVSCAQTFWNEVSQPFKQTMDFTISRHYFPSDGYDR